MTTELPKQYDPKTIEQPITDRWLEGKAFAATPDERENRYVIMMPLPNVTGALHMGHAMDNVMQDLLIRWHRMMGDNTLWMAGTDHAGIATQAVVEKRLFELEGKTRHDIGRETLVKRIWDWKDEYQARIVEQQQAMGCACDWDRQRFTMDKVCARAVRHTFFRMFRDGLIYRGDRLVNWDCHLHTAVSDDELYRKTVQGHFWYIKYPVIDPKKGEPEFITVATTRPETMLGDTGVVCHEDPGGKLDEVIAEAKEKLAAAGKKDKPDVEREIESLQERKQTHLSLLKTIAGMAKDGRKVMLPLMEREIPIITDEWAKPELGTGCVKATPAHDQNDYDVWQRHRDQIDIINILEGDGTLNRNAGRYAGMDRFDAREAVLKDLEQAGLIEKIEDREIEVDHSDRSKTIIEPYLSLQWFVRMGDVDGGVVMARGTQNEFTASGLAQAAIDGVDPEWKSKSGRNLTFHPDRERYTNLYRSWLQEKRDWCISRQLWWGHRIPVWTGTLARNELLQLEDMLTGFYELDDVSGWVIFPDGRRFVARDGIAALREDDNIDEVSVEVCFLEPEKDENMATVLKRGGLSMDEDVLDTWFSSALWPHSTLGWPDPKTAALGPGQSKLDGCLSYYYPGSCLVTARDIITLWVARMMIMGLYNLGDVPFTDSFIHANIQDGKGQKMSKSAGNGIDPVDIIEAYGADAMRYVICDLQTGTQDVRLPVQAISPFTGEVVDLATAKHGSTIFTYLCPKTGKEFDVLGTMADVPSAKLTSKRFEDGRNFCNKLWNAARFALMNLGEHVDFHELADRELMLEDRWILSRLSRAIQTVQEQLELYNPSAAIGAARGFFWGELCDWYLELIKPRLKDDRAPVARQVLAETLDQVLRLFHPFVPFITEALWEKLNDVAPRRGIDKELGVCEFLVHAAWPKARPELEDSALEQQVALMQAVIQSIREIRARYDVAMSQKVKVQIEDGPEAKSIEECRELIANMAGAESVTIGGPAESATSASAIAQGVHLYVLGVVDTKKEIAKLDKQIAKLEQQIKSTEGKLNNKGFVDKAPKEVVERERSNLEERRSQHAALTSRRKELQKE
ncbi:MAG: class I tRNA ligase family protein [Planctomycetota bacterium]|jgi:valyl-tRNA synthetase